MSNCNEKYSLRGGTMWIADGVYVLPIPRGTRGADGYLNLTLILDEQNGNTLVDAGLPGLTQKCRRT